MKSTNKDYFAMFANGYYFCRSYLFIMDIFENRRGVHIVYRDDDTKKTHTKKVYNPHDNAYFIHNGERVHVADCEYITIDNGYVQRTATGVNIYDFIKNPYIG